MEESKKPKTIYVPVEIVDKLEAKVSNYKSISDYVIPLIIADLENEPIPSGDSIDISKLKTAMQSLNDRVNSLATVLDKLHNHVYDKPSSTNKPIENTPKPISEESLVNQWMNKTSSYDPEIHLPPGEDDDSPSMDI